MTSAVASPFGSSIYWLAGVFCIVLAVGVFAWLRAVRNGRASSASGRAADAAAASAAEALAADRDALLRELREEAQVFRSLARRAVRESQAALDEHRNRLFLSEQERESFLNRQYEATLESMCSTAVEAERRSREEGDEAHWRDLDIEELRGRLLLLKTYVVQVRQQLARLDDRSRFPQQGARSAS